MANQSLRLVAMAFLAATATGVATAPAQDGVSAGVGADAGGVSAGVGASAGVDSDGVSAGVGASAGVDSGGVSAGVGASAGVGSDGVSAGAGVSSGGGSAATGVGSGASAGMGGAGGFGSGASAGSGTSSGTAASGGTAGDAGRSATVPYTGRYRGFRPLRWLLSRTPAGRRPELPAGLLPAARPNLLRLPRSAVRALSAGESAGPGAPAMRPVAGTPRRVVLACRDWILQGAWPYNPVRVDVASAGALARQGEETTAPLQVRIVYRRDPGLEVRQAVVSCHIDQRGAVVAVT